MRAGLLVLLSVCTAGCAAGCSAGDGFAGGSLSIGLGAGTGTTEFKPVATVDQIMDAIVIPASQAIFDAVVYDNGQLVQSPQNDDDWLRLQMQALAVAEAGNLLKIPPRAKDGGDWMVMSTALTDAAVVVARAAEGKDIDRLLQTGSEMYNACTACHNKYIPE